MKLRDYLIGASLGLVGIVSGCNITPQHEEKALGFILGANGAVNPNLTLQQRAGAAYTGKIINDYNIAREGRSQIIIVNPQPLEKSEVISEEERMKFNDAILREYGLGPYNNDEKEREEVNDRILREYGLGPYNPALKK